MRNAKRNQRVEAERRRDAMLAQAIIPRPPQQPTQSLTRTHPFRYVANVSVAQGISWSNLMDTQVNASSATQGWQLYDAVRINSITIWGASSLGTTSAFVTFVDKVTGKIGDQRGFSDTALSIGAPLYLRAVPSKKSATSQFQVGGSDIAFTISCPAAAVIELNLTFRNNYDAAATVAVTQALVSATPGDIYQRGFDGLAIATTKFTPTGVVGIV
jgi:hypothetical protein